MKQLKLLAIPVMSIRDKVRDGLRDFSIRQTARAAKRKKERRPRQEQHQEILFEGEQKADAGKD